METEAKKAPETEATVEGEKTPERQWESFPKPRGWSMDWDERGLVPGSAGCVERSGGA